jgi:TIR domain
MDELDDNRIRIPADSVPILDLLLRAGLCTPALWADTLTHLHPVERDEMLDALSLGAMPLPQLTWEWGATVGEVDTLAPGGGTVNLSEFYQSLEELTRHFPLQISVPLIGDYHEDVDVMPPFDGQRLHLVNRGQWMNLTLPPDDLSEVELDDAEIPEGLPIFTDPALQVGERRVGEAWVRVAPDVVDALRSSAEELFNLLVWLADVRVKQLRETLRQRQHTLTEADLAPLQQQLIVVTSWQRHLWGVKRRIDELPEEQRRGMFPQLLDLATGHTAARKSDTREGNSGNSISVFISYARESDEHVAWVRHLAELLEQEPAFHVIFDEYDLHAGKDLTHFMESGLAADRVVIVVTPEYVRKAEQRAGGVGYESSVISADLLDEQLSARYVPVLRRGKKRPSAIRSKLFVDFRDDSGFGASFEQLRAALLGRPPVQRPDKVR